MRYFKPEIKKTLEGGIHTYTAYLPNIKKPVGYLDINAQTKEVLISNVDKEFRRKKIGTALYTEALKTEGALFPDPSHLTDDAEKF